MALQLKLSRTSINNIGTEMYLSDVTGSYNSETNPGGYGGINQTRNSVALLIQSILHKSTEDVNIEIKEYDPEAVEHFTLLTREDGYIETIMVAVQKTEPTIEFSYGWTSVLGLVQLVGGLFVPKTPLDLYNDPMFLEATSFKTVLLARMAIYRNKTNLELIRIKQAASNDRSHNREIVDKEREFSFVRGLLEGARYQWCMENYTESQRIVESFTNLTEQNG